MPVFNKYSNKWSGAYIYNKYDKLNREPLQMCATSYSDCGWRRWEPASSLKGSKVEIFPSRCAHTPRPLACHGWRFWKSNACFLRFPWLILQLCAEPEVLPKVSVNFSQERKLTCLKQESIQVYLEVLELSIAILKIQSTDVSRELCCS